VREADQLRVVNNDLHPGTILLGHYGGTNTLSVLSTLLERLHDEGYAIVSVADLLAGPAPAAQSRVVVDLALPRLELVEPARATTAPRLRLPDMRMLAVASAPGGATLMLAALFAVLARREARRRLSFAIATSRPFDGT
jgi:hypothetical protein